MKKLFWRYLEKTHSYFVPFVDLPLYWIGRKFVNFPEVILDQFARQEAFPKEAEVYFNELLKNPNLIMHTAWKEANIRFSAYLEFLYVLARLTKAKIVIEIGRFRGRTLAQFVTALRINGSGMVISVDPISIEGLSADYTSKSLENSCKKITFENGNTPIEFVSLFAEFRNFIKVIVGFSHDSDVLGKVYELSGGECDLLFIDGDHSYDAVSRDFEFYSPLVKRGGYIVFDDSYDPRWGVHKLLREVAERNNSGKRKYVKIESKYLCYFKGSRKVVILKRTE